MAWKALYSSKDTWMGATLSMGAVPSIYNLTMDPYEKYDMMFNGAVSTRNPTSSPGRSAGMDNGWALFMDRHSALGIQQVDRQLSEHRTLSGRCLERHDPESSKPEEPIALRSDEAVEDRRSGRGLDSTAALPVRAPIRRPPADTRRSPSYFLTSRTRNPGSYCTGRVAADHR
jgi:hypothetical protein